MTRQPPVTSSLDPAIRARALGWLYVAGATIGLVSLVLPHPAESNTGALWSNVVLAYVGAVFVLVAGRRAPAWFFHTALAAGSLLITRAVVLSGEAVSFYAAWYVWIGLYAFYFFSRAAAATHVLYTAALYAVTLIVEPASSPVARWLTTVATLIVAGAFIDTLVRRSHRHADEAAATADNMAVVARVAHELSAVTDGATARAALCDAACEVTGADAVILWEPTGDGTGLRPASSPDAASRRPEVTFVGPPTGASHAFTSAEPLMWEIGDTGPAPDADAVGFQPSAAAWQPVLRGGVAIGVLAFYWRGARPAATGSVQTLIELLAAETAATMQRMELIEQLETVARTDDLTGLPNRRAWNEQLLREVARARREESSLCVAILDLDHFKTFNDSFGHQAGDRFLKHAAARWAGELRTTDVLARYGGEEFALALPGADEEQAAQVIERLRLATPDGESCSAGAVWWDGTETPAELLGRADAALYDAKRAGRARAVFA